MRPDAKLVEVGVWDSLIHSERAKVALMIESRKALASVE